MDNENKEVVEEVVNANPTKAEEVNKVDTGVTPDVNVTNEEVKEGTPVDTNKLTDDQVDEYANKYDAMVKENEELKAKLDEGTSKYSALEEQVKTLQEGMAKLRKANEFASSRNSNQQNQRVENEINADDIIALRRMI